MPTLQTTPWIDWTFPDQAYARNKVGHVWGPAQEMPRLDEEVGAANPFDAHDKAVALERVRNNHRKMLGQMGVLDTTERSQRHRNKASQSASHINGRIETAQSQTAGGLRGGAGYDSPFGQFIPTPRNGYAANTSLNNLGADTDGNPPRELSGGTQYFFYSPEGQSYLTRLRNRRVAELNAIEKGDFSGGPPKPVEVSPSTDDLDAALAKVLDEFESGAFPNSMIDDLNKVQGALLRLGATITDRKLAQYVQVLGNLKRQSQRLATGAAAAGPLALDAQSRKVLRASGLVLDRLERLCLEINRVINEPADVRQRAVAEIGSRILGSTSAVQAPFGTQQRQPGRTREERGMNAVTGLTTERQIRQPEPLPDASLVTSAGEPPVRPF